MGVAHPAHVPGRVGPAQTGLGHLLAWGFLATPSSCPKSNALIFPSPSEVAAAAKLLIPSEGDQILLLWSSGEGGNHRHRHHLSSLVWEEASTSSPHQDQHHLHHHHRDPLRSPRSLRVAIP